MTRLFCDLLRIHSYELFFEPAGGRGAIRAATCRNGNYVVVAREYSGRKECAAIEKFYVDEHGSAKSEVQFTNQ